MNRGWTSEGLKVVTDDDRLWTVADAAVHLGPPALSVSRVRQLVRDENLQPVGKRRTSPTGTSGRYARVYRAVDFIKAHDALASRTA